MTRLRVEPRILLSGPPGSGKSTLAARILEVLRRDGVSIAGMITPEIRLESRERSGFRIIDLMSGLERVMASVEIRSSVRVGKYGVDIRAINDVVESFLQAAPQADLLLIDEIGPMELKSPNFEAAVEQVLQMPKPVLAVVHRSLITRFEDVGEIHLVSHTNAAELERVVLASLREALRLV